MEEVKLKGPIEYIKEAWAIYTQKENFVFFARIMAVLVLLSSAIGFISGYLYPADYINNIDYSDTVRLIGFAFLSLAGFLLSIWSEATTYMAIFNVGQGEKSIFSLGYKKMWKFLLIISVCLLIILAGMILLIIPAVIFGTWYWFAPYLVLDKDMSITESLKRSKEMIAGKFWKVFWWNIIFGLFGFIASVLVSAIPYAGSLVIAFVAPLFILPSYLLYRDLLRSN